jgi:Na+-driven multidrug efflux pump
MRALMKIDGPCRVYWRKLRFCWKNLREILWVGIPAGFQSSCFSISNILIQSSINSFGSAAVAGNVAFCLLENFSHATLDAFSQTVITFVSCNYGAGQYERLKKTVRTGLIAGCINGIVWAIFLLLAADWLLSCFNSDPEVLSWGMLRSYYIAPGFIIASVMQINTGAMRGLGHSLEPSLISIFSICILRVVWIFTVFRQFPRMEILLISYPLTWLVNALLVTVLLKITMKKCMSGAKDR